MIRQIKYVIVLICLGSLAQAQISDSARYNKKIVIVGRPSKDSVVLRWAPLTLQLWLEANQSGYVIERYTMTRNENILSPPERKIVTLSPVRPWADDRWEPLVRQNKYAAIAAQALFGDRFEIELDQSDVFSIANKVHENEQRFSFALFCADMSPAVARALGLWFTDKTVVKGEKYLYRIAIQGTEAPLGSIYIGGNDPYQLPKPTNLDVVVKEKLVSLQWSKNRAGIYTAYSVERSSDGANFIPISDTPLTTLSPDMKEGGMYEYAVDSLPDFSRTYSYRVRGITPFGELGPHSDTINATGEINVSDVPYINDAQNIDNVRIKLSWEFPVRFNTAIKGFSIERSSKPQSDFSLLHTVPASARTFEDTPPQQVNYYRITAHGLDGQLHRSPVYFGQLIDSIAPSQPDGLAATIDEFGIVQLTWQPNTETDIYGYRIYRANNRSEELSQLTTAPVSNTRFSDRINLNVLNEFIYYSVMAIDKNQNHSKLSKILQVPLPDKVKPQPPVLLPVENDEAGVKLLWYKSSSEDVARYEVFRKSFGRKEWQRIKLVTSGSDTVYQYKDELTEAGKVNQYTVVAVDDAGLESDPATPINGSKIGNGLKPGIKWKEPLIDRQQSQVVLRWSYPVISNVRTFKVYKSVNDNEITLYKTVSNTNQEISDRLVPGTKNTYRILAEFHDGNKSLFSEEIIIKF